MKKFVMLTCLAVTVMLSGCVVVPAGHRDGYYEGGYYPHDHYDGYYHHGY